MDYIKIGNEYPLSEKIIVKILKNPKAKDVGKTFILNKSIIHRLKFLRKLLRSHKSLQHVFNFRIYQYFIEVREKRNVILPKIINNRLCNLSMPNFDVWIKSGWVPNEAPIEYYLYCEDKFFNENVIRITLFRKWNNKIIINYPFLKSFKDDEDFLEKLFSINPTFEIKVKACHCPKIRKMIDNYRILMNFN